MVLSKAQCMVQSIKLMSRDLLHLKPLNYLERAYVQGKVSGVQGLVTLRPEVDV